jgi:multiple sugar transport system substrate-binding protein
MVGYSKTGQSRFVAAILLVSVALLGACGAEAKVSPGLTHLRIAMADDWASTDAVLATVREFEKTHPGIRVQVDGFAFSFIQQAVAASIRDGNSYDLAQHHAFAAGALGLARAVPELWQDVLDEDEFLPGAIEDIMWAGVPYGIPLDTNAMVLIANQEHLLDAGIDPGSLATFADLAAAAVAVTDEAADRRAIAYSMSSWTAYGWIRANGGELVTVDDDGVPTFLLDSPRTVQALEFLGSLVRDGLAWQPATKDRSQDTIELFLGGHATLIATGAWDLAQAARRAGIEGLDSPSAVALAVPRGSEDRDVGTALGGSSLFFPRGSVNHQLATEFALALIDDERALALASDEGRLPARWRVLDDPIFDGPTLSIVRDHLEFASPMKLIAFDEAQEAFTRALEAILRGDRSAGDALAQAQHEAESSVARS